MKFVLFCLLACCVFENTFSVDVKGQVEKAYNDAVKQVNGTIDSTLNGIKSRNNVGEENTCYKVAEKSLNSQSVINNVDSVIYKLDRCRAGGQGILNLELAKKCMGIEISRFTEDANNVGSAADTCIKSSKK